MRKTLIAASLVVGSAFAVGVHAADGTIDFTGTITDTACDLKAGSQTVTMGTVSSSSLNAAGDEAGPTPFKIVLENCPTAVNAVIKFDGISDADNSDLLALSTGANVATGVAVGLYEKDRATKIPVGSASAPIMLSTTDENTFEFVAKYVATTGTVTPGPANSATDFTVVYN